MVIRKKLAKGNLLKKGTETELLCLEISTPYFVSIIIFSILHKLTKKKILNEKATFMTIYYYATSTEDLALNFDWPCFYQLVSSQFSCYFTKLWKLLPKKKKKNSKSIEVLSQYAAFLPLPLGKNVFSTLQKGIVPSHNERTPSISNHREYVQPF